MSRKDISDWGEGQTCDVTKLFKFIILLAIAFSKNYKSNIKTILMGFDKIRALVFYDYIVDYTADDHDGFKVQWDFVWRESER